MTIRAGAVAATRSSSNLVSKNGTKWLSTKAKYLSGQTAHLRLGGHVGGKMSTARLPVAARISAAAAAARP